MGTLTPFSVTVEINDHPLGMLHGYGPDDPLVPIGRAFVISEADVDAAVDAMWTIGNRQGQDDDGQEWPSGVRSVSVGDVIAVTDGVTSKRVAVEAIGFRELR